jgi:hypothetical protein
MRVQPSKGRYFPITPAEFLAATRDWLLTKSDVSQPRRLKNPDADAEPTRLVTLRPRRFVIVYSLPFTVDPVWGNEVMVKALTLLGRWRAEPPSGVGHSRAIAVYLNGGTTLRVVDERVTFASGKFFGIEGTKKAKVTSRSTIELATLNLDLKHLPSSD